MSRWINFFIVLALGVAAGLFYGWRINPVKYVDTSLETLRQDYQTDYVLMVAESYQNDGDLALAQGRLLSLSRGSLQEILARALQYAEGDGADQPRYAPSDIALLQNLSEALQTLPPAVETP
jgi:hypothetical protein